MFRQMESIVQFYAHKWHVPIEIVTQTWELERTIKEGVFVCIPEAATKEIMMGESLVTHDLKFAKHLNGDLVMIEDTPVARVGRQWLVLLIWPQNEQALTLVKKLIDTHLPKICRKYKIEARSKFMEGIAMCLDDRKRDIKSALKNDAYELERLCSEVMQLSRKIESDREALKIFEQPTEKMINRASRIFIELMKLVPTTYQSFSIEDEIVKGKTHRIELEHYGRIYYFDPYVVEVNLRTCAVRISGGSESNGYIHPHVTDDPTNICWGNVSQLIPRLTGELELFGLFQVAHRFLTTYNDSSPYQELERWDPDWIDEDEADEEFCSWCDEYGHDTSQCDYCGWCEYCDEYVEHHEDDCPKNPENKEEMEEKLELATAETE